MCAYEEEEECRTCVVMLEREGVKGNIISTNCEVNVNRKDGRCRRSFTCLQMSFIRSCVAALDSGCAVRGDCVCVILEVDKCDSFFLPSFLLSRSGLA